MPGLNLRVGLRWLCLRRLGGKNRAQVSLAGLIPSATQLSSRIHCTLSLIPFRLSALKRNSLVAAELRSWCADLIIQCDYVLHRLFLSGNFVVGNVCLRLKILSIYGRCQIFSANVKPLTLLLLQLWLLLRNSHSSYFSFFSLEIDRSDKPQAMYCYLTTYGSNYLLF